jgi:hypothetical protein
MLQTSGESRLGFSQVEGISVEDQACFAELREVLARHNALSRFGITLLHEHFEVAADEILKEYRDEENRVLTIKPVKKESPEGQDVVYTSWELTTGQALLGCHPW